MPDPAADRPAPEPTDEAPQPAEQVPTRPAEPEPGLPTEQAPSAEPAGTDPTVEPVPPVLHPKRFGLAIAIAVTIFLLDQLTKIIAVATLTPGESPSILGGLVYFSLIRNPGAAFSMATGMTWILALVALGVTIAIIKIASRLRSTWWAVSLGLILGGAIGNLIDRIFRYPGFFQGHVVDFVSVFGPNAEYFPVFNVADSAITIGGILLVITALRGIDFDGTRSVKAPKPAAGKQPGTVPDA